MKKRRAHKPTPQGLEVQLMDEEDQEQLIHQIRKEQNEMFSTVWLSFTTLCWLCSALMLWCALCTVVHPWEMKHQKILRSAVPAWCFLLTYLYFGLYLSLSIPAQLLSTPQELDETGLSRLLQSKYKMWTQRFGHIQQINNTTAMHHTMLSYPESMMKALALFLSAFWCWIFFRNKIAHPVFWWLPLSGPAIQSAVWYIRYEARSVEAGIMKLKNLKYKHKSL